MKLVKHTIISLALLAGFSAAAKDVEVTETKYTRSSLCSFLISRTDQNLYDKIQEEYLNLETPNQYNNHDLSIRVLNVKKKAQYQDSISRWLDDNHIASRLVGRWFDRNILTGECSMDLIKDRGLYNATELDKELASRSTRGIAMLQDAGEELIGKTFVLVHEAHYIDHGKRSKVASGVIRGLGIVGSVFLGSAVSDLADNIADMTESIKGFAVKFHTRLYRLVWDDETAGTFYSTYYSSIPDQNKVTAFENGRSGFRLEYIGEVESSGSKTSFMGIGEDHPEIMIRKACQRAIDDNIRDLQHEYEQFRVKCPIAEVDGNTIKVAIGMKEGVNEKSEYEVLEAEEKADGRISYKRIGTIEPLPGKIWDNRYMAQEEGAQGSNLGATSFKVKSGQTPYPGVLVRQIK